MDFFFFLDILEEAVTVFTKLRVNKLHSRRSMTFVAKMELTNGKREKEDSNIIQEGCSMLTNSELFAQMFMIQQ